MKIEIKNIGPLCKAEISFNGMTVIAGKNSTGKSTVLKTLYAIAEASVDLDEKIQQNIMRATYELLYLVDYDKDYRSRIGDFDLPRKWDPEAYKKILDELGEVPPKKRSSRRDPKSIIEYIRKYIDSPNDLEDFFKQFIADNIRAEFDNQLKNMKRTDNAYARIDMGEEKCELNVDGKGTINISGVIPAGFSNVIYLDTPYVLDDNVRYFRSFPLGNTSNHRASLAEKLKNGNRNNLFEGMLTENTRRHVESIISKVVDGTLKRDKGGLSYSSETYQDLSTINLATGMKTFSIIKLLVEYGYIDNDTLLLIDEAEIHLHPEWQIILAELLVLVSKEIGTKIILTTHSPQFLLAIQAHSKKYDLNVDYYNFEKDESGEIVVENVTDYTEKIYRPMADAYKKADQIYESAFKDTE